jgi:hypothetical protein
MVDLGANGARVESAESPGDVRVISRTPRPIPIVEPPDPRPDYPTGSDADEREVTVITGARWRDARAAPPAPWPNTAVPSGADGFDLNVRTGADDVPYAWVASGARRAAAMVGSRAREALLGYPFPAPQGPAPLQAPASAPAPAIGSARGAPGGGEEPAPGQTVVLVGDDVEAWVRERLYGGRLPER